MSKVKGISIRFKIIASLVSLCLLSLLLSSLIVGTQVHTTLKTQAREELKATVTQKANQYNLIFKRLAEELETVEIFAKDLFKRNEELNKLNKKVLMPWVDKGTGYGFKKGYGSIDKNEELSSKLPKIQRIGKLLEGVAASNDLILLAYFVSPDGIFVANDDAAVADIGTVEKWIPKKRPWYTAAISKRQAAWTEPYVDAGVKKTLIVTVASPIYSNSNEFLGIIAFDVSLQTIKDDILSIDLKYESYSLLIGSNGKVIVAPDVDKNSKNWDSSYKTEDLLNTSNTKLNAVARDMVKLRTGLGDFKAKGDNKYIAYAPLEGLDASVGVIVSEKEVVAPAFDILKWIGIVALLIAILAILVGFLLGNSISKPILELTKIANDISTGKAKLTTLEITRKDEIGLLTEAFNRLISSLKIAMKLK